MAGHDLVHHRVADPVHLWKHEQEGAERHPTDGGTRPFGPTLPQPIGRVLEPVQERLERHPDQARSEPEHGDQQVAEVVADEEPVGHSGEERCRPEERTADQITGDRGEDGREHGVEGEFAQDDLEAKEQAGDRRVEGRGDPAGRSTRHDDPQPRL